MNATLKRSLLSSIAVLALVLPAAVNAQTANSSSGAVSGSNADSRSQSGAISTSRGGAGGTGGGATATQGVNSTTNTGVTLNQTSNTSPNTTTNNTSRETFAGGTSNTNQNSNSGYTSSDNIVRTTPTVYAPPVSGGNPCTLAVSGGVSVIGWGAAAGGTFVDQDCADRQKIAMIWNAGFKLPAKELMCNDQKTYVAFKTAGEPCAIRPQWEAPGAAQPVAAPVPVGPPQRVTTSVPPPYQPAGRFVCLNAAGREVAAGTPGASCGQI